MKKKYNYYARRYDERDYPISVYAEDEKQAYAKVRDIAQEIPNPNKESEIIIKLISIEEVLESNKST